MSERKQLLMIDDDPDFVEGIQAILKKKYDLDVAHNPKDGLAALGRKKYDLLLLDIMMGRGAEGVMIARKMSKDPKLRQIPVLIMTGIREQIAFLFGSAAAHPHFVDVDELLEKPVNPKLLLERIEALIEASGTKKTTKAPPAKK
jgi:two-component system, OmpR family, alkaline phosphatase synthesis response regulator PhoP